MYDASSASTTPVNTAMKSAIGIDATPRRAIWVTTCGAQASTSEIALVAARVFAPMPVTNLEKGDADVTKSRASAREARQRATGVAFLEPLQGPISELAHSLTGHAEHLADLLERVLATAVEAEVQSQHSRVARRQRGQRLLDLVGEEVIHRLLLGVVAVRRGEAIDQRAIAVGIEWCVETHLGGVECRERLHHVDCEPGDVADLLGSRLAAQFLAQCLGGADDAREVGGAIEGHANGAAVTGECGKDRLAVPPHLIRDEIDDLVRSELSRRGHHAYASLADQDGGR